MRTTTGALSLAMGLGILGIWILLLASRQVPEIRDGKRSIWYHLGAEGVTALMLVIAGTALLVAHGSWIKPLSAAAFGALLYTSINSAGYYADLKKLGIVAMFMTFAVTSVVAPYIVFIRH